MELPPRRFRPEIREAAPLSMENWRDICDAIAEEGEAISRAALMMMGHTAPMPTTEKEQIANANMLREKLRDLEGYLSELPS